MTIEYKTEARMVLKNSTPYADSAVVTWVMGGNAVDILQGSTGKVTISKSMLLQLAAEAETIGNDLEPNMNSLPRPA